MRMQMTFRHGSGLQLVLTADEAPQGARVTFSFRNPAGFYLADLEPHAQAWHGFAAKLAAGGDPPIPLGWT